jgi:perosamine synthetase
MIPLCIPNTGPEELKAVKKVLDSGWLTEGPKNKEFEENFAKYIGTKYAVSLNSCTSALHLALEALNIKGEVILPSFTFVASANAIIRAGATPVFADIDYNTRNIDPLKIERKITGKTQAIMPVHFGGQSCDMEKILKIAKKYKLAVIEDSAETIGGTFKNKKTGSFGNIGCFSFFPTKNIATGEGGMITTNDKNLAQKIRILSGHGISKTTSQRQKEKKPWFRTAIMAGYNFRMSNILATIGVEQLKKLEKMNTLRRKHVAYLNKYLRKIKQIEIPIEAKNCKHVYQMYTITLKNPAYRDKFVAELKNKGIGASVHFDPPVHLQFFYQKTYKYKKGDFPITEKTSKSIVTLPMYPQLTKKELDYIIKTIREII